MQQIVKYIAVVIVAASLLRTPYIRAQQTSKDPSWETLSDSQKVNRLCKLAYELRFTNTDSAEHCAVLALNVASDDSSRAKAYLWLGTVHVVSSQYEKAIKELNSALSYPLSLPSQARAHNNLGLSNTYVGNYPEAIRQHLASLRIREKMSDKKGIADSYTNIGLIYVEQKNNAEGLKCFSDAIRIRREIKDEHGLAEGLNSYGIVLSYLNRLDEALQAQEEALEIQLRIGDGRGASNSYSNMGFVYDDLKQYRKSIEYYEKALKLRKELAYHSAIAISYENLASAYIALKEYATAEKYALQAYALSRELSYQVLVKGSAEALSVIYEATGRMENALRYYKVFVDTRDSLINQENTKNITRQQMQYEFDKKEAAAVLEQEKKDALATAEKRKQTILLWSIGAFGFLVLIFALFAWRSFLHKRRTNEEITRQKMLIEEKQKEILDSIHYAKRIQQSLLPSEKLIQRHLRKLI